jgi:hypothetical protein
MVSTVNKRSFFVEFKPPFYFGRKSASPEYYMCPYLVERVAIGMPLFSLDKENKKWVKEEKD